MVWLEPWCKVDDLGPQFAASFEAELQRELSDGHLLFGCRATAIGKRDGTDDVLFRLLDGTGRVAVVHLTYSNHPERPPWPGCVIYANLDAWSTSRMHADNDDYQEK